MQSLETSCTCKNLLSPAGGGNCLKVDTTTGKWSCYVNQPTSCSDALTSIALPGEMYSSEPCQGKFVMYDHTANMSKYYMYVW